MSAACAAACFAGCKEENEDWTVYMPDGAPALAFAALMAEDTAEDGVTYRVVAPDLISSKVTYTEESKNADFCVLPVTAASKLLGSGERYTMLGGVTHGNLYLVGEDGAYTAENLSALVGKAVGVIKINEVPGLTLKAVLNKYDIPWQEITNEGGMSATKVNLVAMTGGGTVVKTDCDLLAEPTASARGNIVGDLQALYGGEKGYPQAVLVVKNSLLQAEPTRVKAFVEELSASASWIASASGEQLTSVVSAHLEDKSSATTLNASLLTAEVVARCGISFAYAAAMQSETAAFLSALMEINGKAAAIPQSAFYWDYQK